jgi:hypothetical protein
MCAQVMKGTTAEPINRAGYDKYYAVTIDVTYLLPALTADMPVWFGLGNAVWDAYNVPFWASECAAQRKPSCSRRVMHARESCLVGLLSFIYRSQQMCCGACGDMRWAQAEQPDMKWCCKRGTVLYAVQTHVFEQNLLHNCCSLHENHTVT